MRKLFSLVELLVVIAIIAILAALLLPALNRARDKAKDSDCRGRLKQISSAIIMYGNDFDDYIVPSALRGGADAYWYHVLCGINVSGNPFGTEKILSFPQSFRCPSEPVPMSYMDYGINTNFAGWTNSNGTINYEFRKIGQVKQPSQKIIVSDNARNVSPQVNQLGFVKWRHTGQTASFLFLDWHVTGFRQNQLNNSNNFNY